MWRRGLTHGIGKFNCGGSSYEGQFIQNEFHGRGGFIWADGRRYVGAWRHNMMHGEGFFSWTDGRIYFGSYVDDKKHGLGRFAWPDGRSWVGYWAEGKQHGEGIERMPDGLQKGGIWEEGALKSYSASLPKLYDPVSLVLKGTWKDQETLDITCLSSDNKERLSLTGTASEGWLGFCTSLAMTLKVNSPCLQLFSISGTLLHPSCTVIKETPLIEVLGI